MTMDYGKGLSERIGTLRKENKLTQEQLAKRLGVTSQAVSKWENEQSCRDVTLLPQLADIEKLTQYLSASGASVGEIEDKGFAHFVHFRDPLGHPWLVIREKD